MRFALTRAGMLLFAAMPLTACPPNPGYGFQVGVWEISFPNRPAVYGLNFSGGGEPYLAKAVDLGFGKLPGVCFYELDGINITIEQQVDQTTTFWYQGVMSSHDQASGQWQLEGDPYIGQWSGIHTNPLPLEQ